MQRKSRGTGVRVTRRGLAFALAGAALAVFSSGCATVLHGTHQDVRFITMPPGATAEAKGQSVTTPGSLRLPRKAEKITVHIEKEGYKPVDVVLQREGSGAFWANCALIPVGMVVGYQFGNRHQWFGGFEEATAGAVLAPLAGFVADAGDSAAYGFQEEVVVALEAVAAQAPSRAGGQLARASPPPARSPQ